MKLLKGVGEFFGLDIGTNSVRVVQLAQRGDGGFVLKNFGYAPVDEQDVLSDSEASQSRLKIAITTAINQSGIKTKNVVVGVPSSKTFITVVDVAARSQLELDKIMRYQVDQFIPMSSEGTKVDWALLGPSLNNAAKQEVILASVDVDYSEKRLDFVESLGLNVIALEPDPLAMSRALNIDNGNSSGANLVLNMSYRQTDVAVMLNGMPRLIRSLPIGLSTMINAVNQNLSVKEDQARQFVMKFGLEPGKLDDKIILALEGVLDNFINELSKTIRFFQTKYASAQITQIIVSGYASTIPAMSQHIANKTNMNAVIGNPWINVSYDNSYRQVLEPIASEFAVAIGLAQRSNNDL